MTDWKDTATRASEVCRVLERAWALLRTDLPDLPAGVVVLPFSTDLRFGHFIPCHWQSGEGEGAPEIAVHAGLFGSPPELLAVLLHEGVHALLHTTNGGCSGPGGQYHKRAFRDVCQELGLTCEFVNTRHGFSKTTWPPEGIPPKYGPVLDLLETSLPPGAVQAVHLPAPGGAPLPRAGRVALRCSCRPRRTISAPRATAQAGGIHCGYCGEPFLEDVPVLEDVPEAK